jgi:penicillin-binding protein 2
MMTNPEDRSPLTPQLALRAAIVGSLALGLFAIIFFRLWFLQVLSGNQYLAQAQTNRTRDIAIAAPRGEILDSGGTVLVDSVRSLAVQISPPDLPVPVNLGNIAHPAAADQVVYNRLARIVGVSRRQVTCPIPGQGRFRMSVLACDVAKSVSVLPYADVTVREPVSKFVQFYLAERAAEFPGVQVQRIYVTHYPKGTLAAQVLGTVGRIDAQEYRSHAYAGASQNALVGQEGLEAEYDSFLRGTDGAEQVQVNALGQAAGTLPTKPPIPGHNLRLSLNAKLQAVGEQALKTSIDSNYGANAGSFVAMNPVNGEIYAMGSYPTFNPSIFTKPISQSAYSALTNPADGAPLLNRAIQSFGPTGSTFKPITATAAMQSGVWSPSDVYDDTGQFCFAHSNLCLHNAGHAAYGVVNMVSAIKVSDDVFFYHLGALTNVNPFQHPNGGPVDQWARKYGIGSPTGVDLPGELPGTLPTPRWRAAIDRVELNCEKRHHVPPSEYFQIGHTCGIADGRPWSIGDNVNLSVGQGDVQVSPLQLAVVYAALANGGSIVRPHLGLDVQSENGTVLQTINPGPVRHLNINPTYLQTILTGLREAASSPGGTSADVMGNFPEQVYAKTGTAQYNGQPDYAWYACFVPPSATRKPIVVIVHVERGGFGDVAAAPVARQILSQWFFGHPGAYQSGTSTTL